MKLWHYTCSHAKDSIQASGVLQPCTQPMLPGRPALVWLTDLDAPDREALGLTSTVLDCDRTEYRFAVALAPAAQRFDAWADAVGLPPVVRAALTEGRRPEHWFISSAPVIVAAGPSRLGVSPGPETPQYPLLLSHETGGGEYGASPCPRAESP